MRCCCSTPCIALFPVLLVVMNSFKSRAAIFGSPLAPPTATTFDLDRLHHGAEAGRFLPLFPEQPDRHGRLAVLRAPVRRHGRLRAVRIPLPRQHADGPLSGARHHDPDPARHRRHPADDGGRRAGQYADRADPGLHRARAAAVDLHPVGIHETGVRRSEERRADRRALANTASSSAWCCRWCVRRWRRSRCSP